MSIYLRCNKWTYAKFAWFVASVFAGLEEGVEVLVVAMMALFAPVVVEFLRETGLALVVVVLEALQKKISIRYINLNCWGIN